MTAVDIFNVQVLDNPAPFEHSLQFDITYDVREPLKEDIEWKVIYVGSAEDESKDQELDAVLLPADKMGRFKFVLEVEAPDPRKIPPADLVGVTIVLLTCSYKDAEFIRVGYYVSNEYPTPELNENPPQVPQIENITRTIDSEKPRYTQFPHKFDFDEAVARPVVVAAEPELSTDGTHLIASAPADANGSAGAAIHGAVGANMHGSANTAMHIA